MISQCLRRASVAQGRALRLQHEVHMHFSSCLRQICGGGLHLSASLCSSWLFSVVLGRITGPLTPRIRTAARATIPLELLAPRLPCSLAGRYLCLAFCSGDCTAPTGLRVRGRKLRLRLPLRAAHCLLSPSVCLCVSPCAFTGCPSDLSQGFCRDYS